MKEDLKVETKTVLLFCVFQIDLTSLDEKIAESVF